MTINKLNLYRMAGHFPQFVIHYPLTGYVIHNALWIIRRLLSVITYMWKATPTRTSPWTQYFTLLIVHGLFALLDIEALQDDDVGNKLERIIKADGLHSADPAWAVAVL